MSVQRPARFFSDDRQIVSKSLPEVDQKSQKSDQNRHRFTSYSTLHYTSFGAELRAFAAKRAPTAAKFCASAARVTQTFRPS